MREIIFRGKDVNSNEWRIGYFYTAVQGCVAIIGDGFDGYQVKHETVGQYTGLKDRNGTKIFENDILSAHPDELFPDDEIRLVVEWHDYGWFGKDSKGRYTSLESKWVSELFEVIGNRFDNPELLKG